VDITKRRLPWDISDCGVPQVSHIEINKPEYESQTGAISFMKITVIK
jgi:hypothetical protein